MPWFRVDDGFHSHPKVLATSLAARGLWATAGSWSSDNLTDGVVPDHVLASLGGTPELAAELVTAGLWRRRRGAHVFHQWHPRNPLKKEVVDMREKRAVAGRKGGVASGKARSKPEATSEANASAPVEPPNRKVREPTGSPNLTAAANGRPARRGRPAANAKPPWCGTCDETTRQLDRGDQVERCPRCHPLAAGMEAESWRATHQEVYGR